MYKNYMIDGLEIHISNFADEIKLQKTSKPFLIPWRHYIDYTLGLIDGNCRYTKTFKSSSKRLAEEITVILKVTGTVYLIKEIKFTVQYC